jgi:hypothetical protein
MEVLALQQARHTHMVKSLGVFRRRDENCQGDVPAQGTIYVKTFTPSLPVCDDPQCRKAAVKGATLSVNGPCAHAELGWLTQCSYKECNMPQWRGPIEACPKYKKCGRCLAVKYCSEACQLAHWKAGHKQECKPVDKTAGHKR